MLYYETLYLNSGSCLEAKLQQLCSSSVYKANTGSSISSCSSDSVQGR